MLQGGVWHKVSSRSSTRQRHYRPRIQIDQPSALRIKVQLLCVRHHHQNCGLDNPHYNADPQLQMLLYWTSLCRCGTRHHCFWVLLTSDCFFPHGRLYMVFFLFSSFDNVAVLIVEWHRQCTENDRLMSMCIEKCFEVLKIQTSVFVD